MYQTGRQLFAKTPALEGSFKRPDWDYKGKVYCKARICKQHSSFGGNRKQMEIVIKETEYEKLVGTIKMNIAKTEVTIAENNL